MRKASDSEKKSSLPPSGRSKSSAAVSSIFARRSWKPLRNRCSTMTSRFQAAPLVASPSCADALAWSDENLVAVASGHLVTILNPATPFAPRGLIMIPSCKPFPIGVVERKDLLSDCLLSICLSREVRPCARSIAWSPIGFAPNSGCILAVCTIEGRVKLYRMPYCEHSADWVEVGDISEKLFASINFEASEAAESDMYSEQANGMIVEHKNADDLPIASKRRESKRKRQKPLALTNYISEEVGDQNADDLPITSKRRESKRKRQKPLALTNYQCSINSEDACAGSRLDTGDCICTVKEVALCPHSLLQEGSSVEVLRLEGDRRSWVTGTLMNHLNATKALVVFSKTNENGDQDEWVEIDSQYDNNIVPPFLDDDAADQNKCTPILRPSMNISNLPQQLLLCNTDETEEALIVGSAVEVWTEDRWTEGIFMGLDGRSLLVKFPGDAGSFTIDASLVRLAPSWVHESKSWHVASVEVKLQDHGLQLSNQEPAGVEKSNSAKSSGINQIVLFSSSKEKSRRKTVKGSELEVITPKQYASRSAMLSSTVVAWSPVLQLANEIGATSMNYSPQSYSILSVGTKSGKISFWKILAPQCYSVLSVKDPTAIHLIGLLEAHSAWITAIRWTLLSLDSVNPQLLLLTGSSDGSVKIWLGYSEQLLESSDGQIPFSLLQEVIPADSVPVSIIAVHVPLKTPNKIQVAVGKTSGSFDVWIGEMSATCKFSKIGSYAAHDHSVSGLVWSFDGCYLNSCSQDDSVRSWILCDDTLCEVPISSNSPSVKSSNDVPNVFDSCFGLAASPGNLVIAMVRSFDVNSLNPMYQARSQKAAVEFFWNGGRPLRSLSDRDLEITFAAPSDFSTEELAHWKYNILWSLQQCMHGDKPLVVWDIVGALLEFKSSAPKYVEHVLTEWVISFMGFQLGSTLSEGLSQASRLLPDTSSRKLQILNVIIRRVVLSDMKADSINFSEKNLDILDAAEEEEKQWLQFLLRSERELRERLVSFSLSVILRFSSHSPTNFGKGAWRPVGLAQMRQWVELKRDDVRDHLKLLEAQMQKLKKSELLPGCEDREEEEQCSYCSAPVPFESAEVGHCQGADSHKLFRCGVSMQVCPITPSWFCVCCQRWVSKLAPSALFKMAGYPSTDQSSILELVPKPFCPFCGILLQRLQPDFLLSTSPV